MLILILRMLSGLIAGFWGFLSGKRRKERFEASSTPSFQPEPTTYIPATAMFPLPRLLTYEQALEEERKLHNAAEWHAKAARKAVLDDDGDGVIEHMRNFRRYSLQICDAKDTVLSDSVIQCVECGSTCSRKDMTNGPRLQCGACDETRADDSWTDKDGQWTHIRDMYDKHLIESADKVKRWLRNGDTVNDDRIRMCGHVLQECNHRMLELSVGG